MRPLRDGPLLRFPRCILSSRCERDEESEPLVVAIVSLQLSRDPPTERAAALSARRVLLTLPLFSSRAPQSVPRSMCVFLSLFRFVFGLA